MATVRVPAVQGTELQNPAVPEAARVDQDPAAVVPVAVPAVQAAGPVAQAPAVPVPTTTNNNSAYMFCFLNR